MASGTERQFLSMPKFLPGIRFHLVGQDIADHPLLQILTSLQVLLPTSSRLARSPAMPARLPSVPQHKSQSSFRTSPLCLAVAAPVSLSFSFSSQICTR